MKRHSRPHRRRRPLVWACLAISLDGKIASPDKTYHRLTGESDRRHLDRLRAWADAVIVGAGTIRAEGFAQKVRFPGPRRQRRNEGRTPQPLNVCISRRLDLPFPSRYFADTEVTRWIFCSNRAPARKITRLEQAALVTPLPSKKFRPAEIVRRLGRCGLGNLLLEGGGELLYSFLREKLIDRLYLTVSPILIGGRQTPGLVGGPGFPSRHFPQLKLLSTHPTNNELYLCYKLKRKNGDGGQ